MLQLGALIKMVCSLFIFTVLVMSTFFELKVVAICSGCAFVILGIIQSAECLLKYRGKQ